MDSLSVAYHKFANVFQSRCECAGVLVANSESDCPEWEAVFDPGIYLQLQVRLYPTLPSPATSHHTLSPLQLLELYHCVFHLFETYAV